MNLIQLGLDAGILALCCEVVFRQKAEIKAKDFFVFPILLVLCVVPRVDFSIGANMTASFRSEGFEILPADNIVGLLFLIFAVLLLSSIFFGSKSSGTVFCGTMAAFSVFLFVKCLCVVLFAVCGKTAKSILISCGARLAPFDIAEVREITMYDELELDLVGDRKTALFFIISDTDATFNFLVSMAYTQLFNLLCERADDKYGGRLPIHVRCLIDEAANIGQIPNLEKLMATIRSREISACLVLQAQSQLKALYKDNMDTIIGNCDSSLFLGGKEETTLKSWSTLLGKETIDMFNTSVTKGNQESHGQNFQKLGKDLMSMDELAVMDGGKCLLQVRGIRPFLSKKYDITQHPNYKYLSDSNPKYAFDIEKFLSTRMPVKPGEAFINYEISPEELAQEYEGTEK